ncbi:MAG: nqrF [Chlamydiales bacterium]|jgi:Na+-transporting NADH:ubiquinone oxidoreductase subunit F|nr:nqrF [Chlamydiales bacterium]
MSFNPIFAMMSAEDVQTTLYSITIFVTIGVGLAAMILYTRAKLIGSALCKIYINDDASMTKETTAGNTLLNTLTSNGVPVPSPCGGKATCKQCKVQVFKGGGDALETELSTFSKKQLEAGWRLSCQCKVKNDVHVHIEPHLLGVKQWKCKVLKNENVATYIKELVIELPEGEVVDYKSGGYLQIHVPPYKTNTTDWKQTMDPKFHQDWEKYGLFNRTVDFSHLGQDEVIRAYSMASYPAEGRKLMFNIRIATPPFVDGKLSESTPWGVCSTYTFSLKPGDDVMISGPYGESFMINDNRELIFLIGGAGSSFGRSHIMHLFRTENTKRKATLWYGARSVKENIYQDEYEKLARDFPNFKYNLVLSEPLPEDLAAGWPAKDPVKTNFLFKAFEEGQLKHMKEPESALFYVCGPPLHNKSVMKLLDDYGVPRENIVLDDFGS